MESKSLIGMYIFPYNFIDDTIKPNEAPGTFRYKDAIFPVLPGPICTNFTLTKSWAEYSATRLKGMKIEPQIIDALSFPITIAYALNLSKIIPEKGELSELNIVLMGATEKAEQRIFMNSDYFNEIPGFLPNVKKFMFHFVGPEITISQHLKTVSKSEKIKATFYKGKIMEFLKEMGIGLKPTNTIFIGLNTGLGIKYAPLILSWTQDLKFIFKRGFYLVLTSANDYEDLKGETFVMNEIFGAKYIMDPLKNPFMGMTRYQGIGKDSNVFF